MHKIAGSLPYTQYFYTHFWTEHIHTHHRELGTPTDAVSHELGTSLYAGIVNAVIGTHRNTWAKEIRRISKWVIKTHERQATTFELLSQNCMVHYFCLHLAMICAIGAVFGKGGLHFQAFYTVGGLFWLEAVNFLEHYGLRRRKLNEAEGEEHASDSDGRDNYEAICGMDSWNAPASTIGFKLQRHSDHHAHSFRPYQILRHFDDMPMLPYEYVGMLWLGLCPPMIDMVIKPRVEAIKRARAGVSLPQGVVEDKWNLKMPMSPADQRRDVYVKVYFLAISIVFTAVSWSKGL